eukprot:12881442-Prorocentrum_lima.AAC.1
MRPTVTNKVIVTNLAANQLLATPTAAGVEEVTRKSCQSQGCPLGRRCQYDHPKDCPGQCFIGG